MDAPQVSLSLSLSLSLLLPLAARSNGGGRQSRTRKAVCQGRAPWPAVSTYILAQVVATTIRGLHTSSTYCTYVGGWLLAASVGSHFPQLFLAGCAFGASRVGDAGG